MNNTYIAESKNIKISPRKVRLIVDGIKKLPVASAIATLSVANQRASIPVKKALQSAVANAVNNGKISKEDLFISEMFVNEGLSYKRYHFAARGRTRPYKKRTSHLKVILGVKQAEKPTTTERTETKTENAEKTSDKTVAAKKGDK